MLGDPVAYLRVRVGDEPFGEPHLHRLAAGGFPPHEPGFVVEEPLQRWAWRVRVAGDELPRVGVPGRGESVEQFGWALWVAEEPGGEPVDVFVFEHARRCERPHSGRLICGEGLVGGGEVPVGREAGDGPERGFGHVLMVRGTPFDEDGFGVEVVAGAVLPEEGVAVEGELVEAGFGWFGGGFGWVAEPFDPGPVRDRRGRRFRLVLVAAHTATRPPSPHASVGAATIAEPLSPRSPRPYGRAPDGRRCHASRRGARRRRRA